MLLGKPRRRERRPWRSRVKPEAFYEKTQAIEGGCLLFTGGRTRGGYGAVSIHTPQIKKWAMVWNEEAGRDTLQKVVLQESRQRTTTAHHYAWEINVGPVPEGHEIHHECPNITCIRIAHLKKLKSGEHQRLHHAERRTRA
jgi:hypothetical protein